MRKYLTTSFGIISLLWTCYVSANDSISINFGEIVDSNDRISLDSGTNYGVVPVDGAFWNLQAGKTGSISSLRDSTGTATAASVTWASPNTWRPTATAPTTADARIFWSYLDDSSGNTVSIADIPYEIYDIYVYSATDNSNVAFGPVSANGAYYSYLNSQTATGRLPWGNSNSSKNPNSTFAEGSNYLHVSDLAGDLTFSHFSAFNGARGCTSAIQVVSALASDYAWNRLTADASGNVTPTASNTGLKITFDSSSATTITTSQAASSDILKLEDANAPAAQSNVTLKGGALTFAGSHAAIYANALSNYSVLTIENEITADTLTLYANGQNNENPGLPGRVILNSAFTGKLRLASGILTSASNALGTCSEVVLDGGSIFAPSTGTFSKNLKIASGGGLRVGASATLTYDGTLSDEVAGQGGIFRKTNQGTLNFTGSSANFTGTFVSEYGTFNFNGDSLKNSSANLVANGGSLVLNGDLTGFTGSITSASNVTIASSLSALNCKLNFFGGTVTLSGNSDGFSGSMTGSGRSSQTLNVTGDFTNYSGTLTFVRGTASFSGSLNGLSGSFLNHASGAAATFKVTGSLEDFSGTIDSWGSQLSDGTLYQGNTNLESAITGTGTIRTSNYGVTTISGSLEGFEGTVITHETNASTVITGSLNGFAGKLQVDAGSMTLGTESQTASDLSAATIALNGGTLQLNYGGAYVLNLPGASGSGLLSIQGSTAQVTVESLGTASSLQADGATIFLNSPVGFSASSINGGKFVLPASTLTAAANATLNGALELAGSSDLTFRPNGFTLTLAEGASLNGVRNVNVVTDGTVALAGAKALTGSVNVTRGAVKLAGDVAVLPAGVTVNLGDGQTRAGLIGAGANQSVSVLNLLGASGKIQSESGALTVSSVNRSAGTSLLVQKNDAANTLELTAGDGFTMVGTAGNEILPGVSYVTGTGTADGNFAMLSGGKIVKATNFVNVASLHASNPDFAVEELANKVVFNNWSWKSGDNFLKAVSSDMTFGALLTQEDFAVTNGATLTLSSGTLILQGGGHWIQGYGKITSSYSSDGGVTNDFYLFSNGTTSSELRFQNVCISDCGSTPVNVLKDGEGIVKFTSNTTYSGRTEIRAGILRVMNASQTSDYRILNGGTLEMRASNQTQVMAVAEGGTLAMGATSSAPKIAASGTLGGTVLFTQFLDANNLSTTIASSVSAPEFQSADDVFEAIQIAPASSGKTVTVNFSGAQTARTQSFVTSGIANFQDGFTLYADSLDVQAGTASFAAGSRFFGAVNAAPGTITIASDAFNVTGDSALNGALSLIGTANVGSGAELTLQDAVNSASGSGTINLNGGTLGLVLTDPAASFTINELGLAPGSSITVNYGSLTNTDPVEIFSAVGSDYAISASQTGAWLSDALAELLLTPVIDPLAGTVTWQVNASAVPEPAAWLLLLLGFSGLFAWRERNRKISA